MEIYGKYCNNDVTFQPTKNFRTIHINHIDQISLLG